MLASVLNIYVGQTKWTQSNREALDEIGFVELLRSYMEWEKASANEDLRCQQ